jgi:GTP-binding protein YchF
MKVALLGFAQSGKKTLFSLLTGRSLPAGHREGEALEGIAAIQDPRVDAIAVLAKPQKIKYAELNVVLCPDLEEGTGSRPWLEAVRRCDLLCVVVRAFASDEVYHPAGSVDAARDRSNIETELIFADLEMTEKRLERLEKEKRAGLNPVQQLEEKTLIRIREGLGKNQPASSLEYSAQETAAIRSLGLVTLAPVLWAYNVGESEVARPAEAPNEFRVSCRIEQEIMAFEDPAERVEYLKGLGLEESGLTRLNQAAYDTLGLMSFYTMGPDECRAWTIRKQTPAPAAGGKIHSDIERGFIRVEVIKYDDIIALGSEDEVKKQGRALLKGRDYIIEDGDICHFRFNV